MDSPSPHPAASVSPASLEEANLYQAPTPAAAAMRNTTNKAKPLVVGFQATIDATTNHPATPATANRLDLKARTSSRIAMAMKAHPAKAPIFHATELIA